MFWVFAQSTNEGVAAGPLGPMPLGPNKLNGTEGMIVGNVIREGGRDRIFRIYLDPVPLFCLDFGSLFGSV
jgi:hypothetical protein